MRTPRLCLVGCGSPDAGDDAVGLLLVESLRGQLPREVEIRTDTAGGVGLLDWCEGIQTLILVDAALATATFRAGQWRRLNFPEDQPHLEQLTLGSTHALGIREALELALQVGRLPDRVTLFAVAGSRFECGSGISPKVQASLPAIQSAVKAEVLQRLITLSG